MIARVAPMLLAAAAAFATLALNSPAVVAADHGISLSQGKLLLTAPEGWTKKEPKFAGITLYEFAAPAAEGDKVDGRVTIGDAGGGVEANQQRWLAQFLKADGSPAANAAKISKKQVAGCTVHRLDIAGTYKAPQFAPGAGGGQFPDYRMLAVVIEAPQRGTFYVRMYGPAKTIEKHAADFDKMIDALQVK